MTAIVVNYDEAIDPVNLHDVAPAPLPPASPKRKCSSLRQEAKPFANRPEDTRFTQQRLPMWEPMLTLSTSIVICFVIAASCLALGVILVTSSTTLTSVRVAYDSGSRSNSSDRGGAVAQQTDGTVTAIENCYLDSPDDANTFAANHTCYVNITLAEAITGPAYVFYELHGVYQNHRRFGSSMDRTQFTDEWDPATTLTTCAPLTTVKSLSCDVGQCSNNSTRAFFPCGLVANTMFNDIFWLHSGRLPNGDTLNRTHLVAKGTARVYPTHPTKNPTLFTVDDSFLPVWKNPNLSRIIPPVAGDQRPHITADYENSTAWVVDPLDVDYGVGVGLENEHWRTWVEIAAMQPFRKAYGRIERDLPAGTTLVFAVQSNYYVRSFGGTKALVVSELSWFGTDNYPLAVFFLAVGGGFFLAGTLFALRKCQRPRPLGDATTLEWKRKTQ